MQRNRKFQADAGRRHGDHHQALPEVATEWLVDELAPRLERPIVDRTGLTGEFDFDLTYDNLALTTTDVYDDGRAHNF